MMKVIILNGSPKAKDNTTTALHDRLFYSNLHTGWSMKVGASVSIARRGGSTATMDVKEH